MRPLLCARRALEATICRVLPLWALAADVANHRPAIPASLLAAVPRPRHRDTRHDVANDGRVERRHLDV